MKIINILFNFKKSAHDNQVLGVERCFIDYAKYLTQRGNQVVSVLKDNMVYLQEVKTTGSQIVEMPASGQGDVITMWKMTQLFFSFKPDVVICHSRRALFFARVARFLTFRKVPIVVINHGIRVEKFLKADYVFAVNNYFTQQLIQAGMSPKRAIAIPNMIEIPKTFTPPVKTPFRKPLRLGSLGRLYPEKNFDKILRAMKILQDQGFECEYVIGGVGPQQKPLEDLAQELGLEKNFKILGWTSAKKEFFENIDIFILPSWGETFGIVLLEAMLYDTPIITSNSWGPDEVIDDGVDGLKVSKDDADKMPQLLAQAIMRLNNDQDFARKLTVNAKQKFFDQYSADVVAKRLNDLLAKIARAKI